MPPTFLKRSRHKKQKARSSNGEQKHPAFLLFKGDFWHIFINSQSSPWKQSQLTAISAKEGGGGVCGITAQTRLY